MYTCACVRMCTCDERIYILLHRVPFVPIFRIIPGCPILTENLLETVMVRFLQSLPPKSSFRVCKRMFNLFKEIKTEGRPLNGLFISVHRDTVNRSRYLSFAKSSSRYQTFLR